MCHRSSPLMSAAISAAIETQTGHDRPACAARHFKESSLTFLLTVFDDMVRLRLSFSRMRSEPAGKGKGIESDPCVG